MTNTARWLVAGATLLVLGAGAPGTLSSAALAAERTPAAKQVKPQRGKASYYGSKFNGRRMANGQRFNPNSNNAAHKTLPLGTTARVTNLENGKTAEVTVQDRGPYGRGRIVDVSPRTAQQLDMKKDGTAPVVVEPIRLPDANARVAER